MTASSDSKCRLIRSILMRCGRHSRNSGSPPFFFHWFLENVTHKTGRGRMHLSPLLVVPAKFASSSSSSVPSLLRFALGSSGALLLEPCTNSSHWNQNASTLLQCSWNRTHASNIHSLHKDNDNDHSFSQLPEHTALTCPKGPGWRRKFAQCTK